MKRDTSENRRLGVSGIPTELATAGTSDHQDSRNTEDLCEQARKFANLVFWVVDLRSKMFTATGDSDLIPEWELGKSISLRTIRSRLVPEDRRNVVVALFQVVNLKKTLERTVRFLRSSGLHRHIEVRAYPVINDAGDVTAIQGLAREVTDRVTTQMMRRQAADHYRDFIDFSPHIPWIADPAGRIVEMSPRYEVLTGQPRAVWDTDAWLDHFHPDDIPVMVAAVTYSLSTGEPYESEYRIRFRDGQWHWVRATAIARRNEAGAIVAWYGFTEHIDRREHTDPALPVRVIHSRSASKSRLRIPPTTGPKERHPLSGLGFSPHENRHEHTNALTAHGLQRRSEGDLTPATPGDLQQYIEANHLCAARALLGWSMAELAKASGLSFSTIRRMEENVGRPKARSLDAAIAALQTAGIEFLRHHEGRIAVVKV